MTRILTFLIIVSCFTLMTSCETEAEKQVREQQAEAAKIILTDEEFAALKPMALSPNSDTPLSSKEVVSDQDVSSHGDCKPVLLNDLLIMFHTGKKRDLLVETNFTPTLSYSIYKRGESKSQMYADDKITYGRCFYENSNKSPRHRLAVSHTAHDYLWYWTTEKAVYEALEADILAAGGAMIKDNLSCKNCGDVTRVFALHGGEIELEHRRKARSGGARPEYEVEIRRSIRTDKNVDEVRAMQIDSFNLYLETI